MSIRHHSCCISWFVKSVVPAIALATVIGCGATPQADTTDATDDVNAAVAEYTRDVEAAMADGPGKSVQWVPTMTASANHGVAADQATATGAADAPLPQPAHADPSALHPGVAAGPDTPGASAVRTVSILQDPTPAPPAANAATILPAYVQLLRDLDRRLADETRFADAGLKPWIGRAALAVIDPRFELTQTELALLDDRQRALVESYQRMFSTLGREMGASSGDDAQQLGTAADTLAEAVDQAQSLRIRNAHLCTSVDGYGIYSKFEDHTFLAGRTQPLIIYAELDHFEPQIQEDGRHLVHLTQQVVLYTEADDLPVWRDQPRTIRDLSQNRRRDFYTGHIVELSNRLSVGRYRLKLSVTDELGESFDELTIPLELVADAKLVRQ